jgi:hypothetical protein
MVLHFVLRAAAPGWCERCGRPPEAFHGPETTLLPAVGPGPGDGMMHTCPWACPAAFLPGPGSESIGSCAGQTCSAGCVADGGSDVMTRMLPMLLQDMAFMAPLPATGMQREVHLAKSQLHPIGNGRCRLLTVGEG